MCCPYLSFGTFLHFILITFARQHISVVSNTIQANVQAKKQPMMGIGFSTCCARSGLQACLVLPAADCRFDHAEGLLEYFPAEVMKDRLVKKPTMKQIKDDVFESHLLSLMLLLDVLDRLLTAKSPYVNQAFSVRFPGQHSSSCQTSCQCKLHLTLNALEQVSVSIDINRGGAAQTSADAEVLQPITSAQQENAASASAWWDLNWPTPTDAEWIIIEQVLGRCILLLKLFSLPRRKRRFPNECRELKQALLNLACKLLSGHISNLRLDMKRVFQLTFPVVLREMAAQSADNSKDAPIWLLGTVLMQRLALDPNILRSGNLGDLGPDFTDPMLGMLMMTLFGSLTSHTVNVTVYCTCWPGMVLSLTSALNVQCHPCLHSSLHPSAHVHSKDEPQCSQLACFCIMLYHSFWCHNAVGFATC